MKPVSNLFLQLTALWAFVMFRLATPPGWVIILFVVTLIGPLAVLAPTVLAARNQRDNEPMPLQVTVWCMLTAASLVVAGALVPETNDQHDYVPLLTVFFPSGAGDPYAFPVLADIGWMSVLVFLVALIGSEVTMAEAKRRARDGRYPAAEIDFGGMS